MKERLELDYKIAGRLIVSVGEASWRRRLRINNSASRARVELKWEISQKTRRFREMIQSE